MKKTGRSRDKFRVTMKIAALIAGVALAFGFASCKAETETEYVDRIIEKEIKVETLYVASPVFTATTDEGKVNITIFCQTEGAVIYYTTDGSVPTAESTKYTQSISITEDTVIQAIAVKEGMENSPVFYARYSVVNKIETKVETKIEEKKIDKTYAAAPVFDVTDAGDGVNLSISSGTDGAVIYYTTDGSTPTAESAKYSDAISLNKSTTVKAIAVKEGVENSPVSVATVTIKKIVEEKIVEKEVVKEVEKEGTSVVEDTTAPANVTNLKAFAKNARVLLTWTDNTTDEDVFGYEVSYSGTSAINRAVLPAMEANTMMVAPGAGGCYVSGLANGTGYTFTVKTVDTSGNKSDGVSASATPHVAYPMPEGFVEVTGGTVSGAVADSKVFIAGRTVPIDDLWVCDHEVTQKEYETYCEYGDSINIKVVQEQYGSGENFPAFYVSWYDAIVYCNLRSIAEGLAPVYKLGEETDPKKWSGIVGNASDKYHGPDSENSSWNEISMIGSSDTKVTTANGYRLPTDAEWEYIARGGNCGIPATRTTYAGSNTVDDVAWYKNNSGSKIHEVKGRNPISEELEIYDMSGNVEEWCFDLYQYNLSVSTPVTGPVFYGQRVKHGGPWNDDDYYCRVDCRYGSWAYIRWNDIGFRVVRNAE